MTEIRIRADKVASVTKNVPLRSELRTSDTIVAQEGYVVVGRIHGEKTVYNQLEDVHGRMVALHDGDIVVGVLGHRNALHGYSGFVPESIQVGDYLQLLNLGGVIGRCTSQNPDVGKPFDVEILGGVLVFPEFEDRMGVPAHIGLNAITWDGNGLPDVPVVYIAGTCMNCGKTSAASRLIRQLSLRGISVGGCKLTGVSLRRDTLQMIDYGAKLAVAFTDAGIVASAPANAVPVAKGLIGHLARNGADVIVAELGDGILGEYGVAEILSDSALMERAAVIVMCANDPVGAWGAKEVMRERFGLAIDVISGPTTDNAVGIRYVKGELGLEAINARTNGAQLGEFIASRLAERRNLGVRSAATGDIARGESAPSTATTTQQGV